MPTPGAETTGFAKMWPIVPETLTDLLLGLKITYGEALPPVIIGENGASFPEPIHASRVEDTNRINYLAGHIQAVADAIAEGVDVEEYTVWSLIDNFEWAAGYSQRFGLVHIDYASGERTPTASYDWLCGVIERSRS